MLNQVSACFQITLIIIALPQNDLSLILHFMPASAAAIHKDSSNFIRLY